MKISMPFSLKEPHPDFKQFVEILEGKRFSEKVHFVELDIGVEVMKAILESMMGMELPVEEVGHIQRKKISDFTNGKPVDLLTEEEEKAFIKNTIKFFCFMGYDYVPERWPTLYYRGMIKPPKRIAIDTASLTKESGKREWVEESKGVISSWEELEKFPWNRMELRVERYYEFIQENLPEGMKIVVNVAMYERVMEHLLGYEGLFYLIYDDPDLVKVVFNKWGQVVYNFYQKVISLECVGAIFHADDLGYKTGTMLSPESLRKLFFPCLKEYVSLAHKQDKTFWYHCCGNVGKVIEELIEGIKIDAFHSFQDVITPVGDFQKKYGNKIAVLGGVDVDKLARLDKEKLRKYVRTILNECMPRGRYALGSGNSISNYIPVENYITMLEEGLTWRKS